MGSCPLSGMVPVRIPISFWSCVRGWHFLSWVRSLALSKWTDDTASFWENFQNHRTLLHTQHIPGEVNLHLMKVRSKLSGSQYLTVLPDPGLIIQGSKSSRNNPSERAIFALETRSLHIRMSMDSSNTQNKQNERYIQRGENFHLFSTVQERL